MSDLQHEDDSREGSQELEDAGEDGAASGFVSPSRPAAAAPATERVATADSSRKRRRGAVQGASRATSPARCLGISLDSFCCRACRLESEGTILSPSAEPAPGKVNVLLAFVL